MIKLIENINKYLESKVIEVLLTINMSYQKENQRLRDGCYNALSCIPNCIYEEDVKVYLENALWHRPLLKKWLLGELGN